MRGLVEFYLCLCNRYFLQLQDGEGPTPMAQHLRIFKP